MKSKKEESVSKCPNCGSNLDSFVTECPFCKSEIKNKKSSKVMEEFSDGIQKIMSYKKEKKDSLLKKVIGTDFSDDDKFDEKREKNEKLANYIEHFPVPNSKEDLMEFMILASSRLKTMKNESQKVKDAWISKTKQIYEKSKLSINDDKALNKINEMYEESKKYFASDDTMWWYYWCLFMLFGFSFGLLALSFFAWFAGLLILISIGLFAYYFINNKCFKFGNKVININDKKLYIICGSLLVVAMIFFGFHSIYSNSKEKVIDNYYKNVVDKYDVELDIEFEENLIFNKFDVDVSVYDQYESLKHGEDKVIHFYLTNGTHKIKFTSADGEISNTVKLEVDGNTRVKYHLSCHFEEIRVNQRSIEHNVIISKESENNTKEEENKTVDNNVTNETNETNETVETNDTKEEDVNETEEELSEEEKNEDADYFIMIVTADEYVGTDYKQLEEDLKEWGCTNVKLEAKETTDSNNKDGTIVDFTINGSHYESFSKFKKDSDIVITYWKNNKKSCSAKILYPKKGSKLVKDYDSVSSIDGSRIYLNIDNKSNKPKTKTYEGAVITDGVYDYISYLKKNGYNVEITKYESKNPYGNYYIYNTDFMVSKCDISWTMNLGIQKEKYIEYDFYINLE